MSHPKNEIEAEKLLGGYATGTLSAQEKTELFTAALKHQELFDALADEEALRELLADPKARQQLLELLEEEPKVVPFWRRRAVMGVAAGLMLLVTTTLLVQRQPEILRHASSTEAPKPAEQPAAPELLKGEAGPVQSRIPSVKSPGRTESVLPGKAKEGLAVPDTLRSEDQSMEKGTLNAPSPAGGAAGVMAKPAPTVQLPAAPAAPRENVEMMAEARADLAATAKAEKQGAAKKLAADRRSGPVPPICTLIRLEDGRSRLTVVWPGEEHLYVLQRAHGAISVLPASRTTPLAGGLVECVFVFPREGIVDIYRLHAACPQPEQLPTEGPVDGHHQRLRPGD